MEGVNLWLIIERENLGFAFPDLFRADKREESFNNVSLAQLHRELFAFILRDIAVCERIYMVTFLQTANPTAVHYCLEIVNSVAVTRSLLSFKYYTNSRKLRSDDGKPPH